MWEVKWNGIIWAIVSICYYKTVLNEMNAGIWRHSTTPSLQWSPDGAKNTKQFQHKQTV